MSKNQNLCSIDGCGGRRGKQRTVCHKHRSQKYRSKNILKACYDNLKNNAKRRGKECTITIEDFKEFCIETEYLTLRGRTKHGYTIDRDNDELGYVKGNLKILENTDNIKKDHRRRKILKNYGQNEFKFVDEIKKDNSDVPF